MVKYPISKSMVLKEYHIDRFNLYLTDLIREGWIPKYETFRIINNPERDIFYMILVK